MTKKHIEDNTIYLDDESADRFVEVIENPPKTTEALLRAKEQYLKPRDDTHYLLKSKANERRLKKSFDRAEKGDVFERDLIE